MIIKPRGLYVHIPFCVRKCNYCDFCSYSISDVGLGAEDAYVDALIEEISSYKREEQVSVDTVFFGGGTPSLLSVSIFEKILSAIRQAFAIDCDAEITIEANP